jgi:hypothetical protein
MEVIGSMSGLMLAASKPRRNDPAEPARLPLAVFRQLEALERRNALSLAAFAAALARWAPALYRDRKRCGRSALCRTRAERVEVLAQRRKRNQKLWIPRDVVTMPLASRNTCPYALRSLFGTN